VRERKGWDFFVGERRGSQPIRKKIPGEVEKRAGRGEKKQREKNQRETRGEGKRVKKRLCHGA